ncbi:hypothetical protein Neosp_015179 [[Neocosmospora] mangrovei]
MSGTSQPSNPYGQLPFDNTDPSTKPAPTTLTSSMIGKDSINGWDVLVSYDEVTLNTLLSNQAQALNISAPLTWSELYTNDFTGDTSTLQFSLTLLQPTLAFADSSNTVNLTFGLAGSYTDSNTSSTVSLPSGLTCVVATNLINVSGTWDATGWNTDASDSQDSNSSNTVVLLEPDISATSGVCIDFRQPQATLNLAPGTSIVSGPSLPLDPTVVMAFLQDKIKAHFSSCGLNVCLAAITNNSTVENSTEDVLQPAEFCFTVAKGALMMWIGHQGGPNTGTRPSGQMAQPLVFSPSGPGSEIPSIPLGRHASVIFSHDTRANLFLVPALMANATAPATPGGKPTPVFKTVTCTSTAGTPGMNFFLDFNSSPTTVAGYSDDEVFSNSYYDGCTVELDENAATLIIDGNQRPMVWKSPALAFTWEGDIKHMTWGPSAMFGGSEGGDCYLTFHWSGTGQWQGAIDATRPDQLAVILDLDPTFSTTKTGTTNMGFFSSSGVPSEYQGLAPNAPSLNITLEPLNYLLTTSLLLPGQYEFLSDYPVAASTSVQAGIATPRDTILTGNIAPKGTPLPKAPGLQLIGPLIAHFESLTSSPAAVPGALDSILTSTPVSVAVAAQASTSGSGTDPTPLTLDDFKNALLSFPRCNMLGDLLTSTLVESPTLSATDLLTKYGFENLVGTDLLSLWDTSLD